MNMQTAPLDSTDRDQGPEDNGAGARAPMDPTQLLDELRLQVASQAESRPYAVLFAAFGIGYVLGGGIPRWAFRMVASAGSRIVAAQLVASVLGESVGSRLR